MVSCCVWRVVCADSVSPFTSSPTRPAYCATDAVKRRQSKQKKTPWQCCNTLVMSDRPSASNIAIGGSEAHARAYDRRQASLSRLFRLQALAISRWLSSSGCAAYCVLQTLHATLQQPADPADQQACRLCSKPAGPAAACSKPADPCSKPTAGFVGLLASLQTLQQPAGQQGLRALQQACRPLQQACRPYRPRSCSKPADPAARRPYRPYSKAKPAGCLSSMASSPQLLGHFPAFTRSPFPLFNTKA